MSFNYFCLRLIFEFLSQEIYGHFRKRYVTVLLWLAVFVIRSYFEGVLTEFSLIICLIDCSVKNDFRFLFFCYWFMQGPHRSCLQSTSIWGYSLCVLGLLYFCFLVLWKILAPNLKPVLIRRKKCASLHLQMLYSAL